MFYVNVETQLFCKSAEDPGKPGLKPWFRHVEEKTFDVTFLHADGTPLDLKGKEVSVAIDNNFHLGDVLRRTYNLRKLRRIAADRNPDRP